MPQMFFCNWFILSVIFIFTFFIIIMNIFFLKYK